MTNNSAPETCTYAAYFNFFCFIILFLFNGGPFVLSENRKFNKKIETLREKSPNYADDYSVGSKETKNSKKSIGW